MKKNLTIIMILLIAVSSSYSQSGENMQALIPIISDIQSITQKDEGRFWNVKYAVPILFVNPENRQTVVFDNGKEPYIVQLENTIPVANTGINWNGKMWAMIKMPLPEDSWECEKLILHEMFHALQPQLGFDSIYETPNAHLEKEEGRVLLRLEMHALLKALEQSNDKDSVYKHITHALSFRNSRYAIYPEAKEEENYLELNEGLAEYTALMMTQRYSPNKLDNSILIKYFKTRASLFEQQGSFVRQFAYETIPLYGYLIQMNIPDWHQTVTKNTNLTDYFINIMNVNSNEEWKTLGLQYNYETIAAEEQIYTEQINADVNVVKEKFFCINHVEIPLFQYNYTFYPLNIRIIETIGEFHKDITIMDNWGKVQVSNGLILDKENGRALLSPVIRVENGVITGDGWELHLNDGWKIEQKGDKMVIVEE